MQRGTRAGLATRNNKLDFGEYGLQVLERAWLTGAQIEAARVAATRRMERKGQLWLRVFPDKPVTRHPAEARMGKGKGAVEFWAAVILPGRIIFEMGGVERELAMEALHVAAQKLPLKCKIIEESEI